KETNTATTKVTTPTRAISDLTKDNCSNAMKPKTKRKLPYFIITLEATTPQGKKKQRERARQYDYERKGRKMNEGRKASLHSQSHSYQAPSFSSIGNMPTSETQTQMDKTHKLSQQKVIKNSHTNAKVGQSPINEATQERRTGKQRGMRSRIGTPTRNFVPIAKKDADKNKTRQAKEDKSKDTKKKSNSNENETKKAEKSKPIIHQTKNKTLPHKTKTG
ncbi:hypothetical protein RFI_26885, partial [Reticulomyxa filosa]